MVPRARLKPLLTGRMLGGPVAAPGYEDTGPDGGDEAGGAVEAGCRDELTAREGGGQCEGGGGLCDVGGGLCEVGLDLFSSRRLPAPAAPQHSNDAAHRGRFVLSS